MTKRKSTASASDGARLEYMPLGELFAREWERNPKEHDIDALRASIRRFGFTNPLVLDEASGRLVAGHGRLHAVARDKADGLTPPSRVVATADDWMVPVLRGISFASETEAEAYLIADNRLTEIGGWNDSKLSDILSDLTKEGEQALAGIGFSLSHAEELVAVVSHMRRVSVGEVVEDAAGEWAGMPTFNQEDQKPHKSVLVHFHDEEGVRDFEQRIGMPVTARFLWFPEVRVEHSADKVWTSDPDVEEVDQ